MDLIERLQKKPERERAQIAFFLTLALFGGILLVWGLLVRADRAQVSAEASTTPSPFEALANVFKASVNTSAPTFERAPASTVQEGQVEEGEGAVEHSSTATTSAEMAPEEAVSSEVLPPPAP